MRFDKSAFVVSDRPSGSALEALRSYRMDSISVPPEFGQGSYSNNWLNNADIALRTGGSPHSPGVVPPSLGGVTASGMGPSGNMTAASSDQRARADEEFKKHVVNMLIQRDTEMRFVLHQTEQMRLMMDAVSIELVKTKAALHEERKLREELMSVMVAKERNEKEESVRRDMEEAKRDEQEAEAQREEWKRMQEAIDRLEKGQQALREHVEKRYDEEELKKRQEDNKKADCLTRAMLEKEMAGDAEEDEKDDKVVHADTPSSGLQTPATRAKTPSSRASGGITCFSCHQEGHYARDCVDLDVECELCGGVGHFAENCIPSKRCYNCNKTGHRHYECKEQGTRRCFHCRKVGHLAMNCKNAPKQ